jgi:hypothetical protein
MNANRRAIQKGRVPDSDGVYHRPRSAHAHSATGGCLICRQPEGRRITVQTAFPAQMSAAVLDQVARSRLSSVARGVKLSGLTEKLASLRGRGQSRASRRAQRDLEQAVQATREEIAELEEIASGAGD